MDLLPFVKSLGYLGIFGIIFAESGLLPAVFLPGDSLLFASGFMAARGKLSIVLVVAGCFIAAVTGNCLGYAIGKRVGRKALEKGGGRFLKVKHIEKTDYFFAKYGKSTIMIGRFLPVVRTFAPFLAGVVQMEYRIFLFYSVAGAVLWVFSLCLLGYYLGNKIKAHEIDEYLTPIVIGIVLFMMLPTAYHLLRSYFSKDTDEDEGAPPDQRG